MNNYELHSRAQELSASHSGYNLARRFLALEEELQEARREFGQPQQAQGERPGKTILRAIERLGEEADKPEALRFRDGIHYAIGVLTSVAGEESYSPAAVPLTDAEINEITLDRLGNWPSFEAQSWACKVVHALHLSAPAAPRPSDDELWDQTIAERDHWEEMASKLAYMVGDHFGFDVGEHSNCNCPVQNALQWDWPAPAESANRKCNHEYAQSHWMDGETQTCRNCGELEPPK